MKRPKVKKISKVLIVSFVCLFFLGTEIILRKAYGLTDAVLFKADKEFEYIPIPQSRFRFRNNIYYNSYSQRNKENPNADSFIILGFGDSVLNGGVNVEQDSLATEKLSKYLSNKYKEKYLFANISAPSWGPDNCFAYLKKYGNFGAKQILLVVNSHDAYDNMSFDKIVGIHQNYPNEQYLLGVMELFDRYLIPRYLNKICLNEGVVKSKNDELGINKFRKGMKFNSGFQNFKNYSDSTGIPLIVYLHAEKGELEKGKYNLQGKEIITFCESKQIPLIKDLYFNLPQDAYLDVIHLTEQGQHYMFEILKEYF